MSAGANLIFLISQPRAGSTLLQKILGAHPEIHTVSEPWVALHPLFALRQKGVSAFYSHALAREATRDFVSEQVYFDGVRLLLNHLYNSVLAPSGKPIFLDKTPRYYFIIAELRRVFPDARFLFLLRNPLAVLSSILEAWVDRPPPGRRCALRLDLLHDLLTAPHSLADAIANPGPNDAIIHYEELVRNPEVEVTRLCERLRLPFVPEMVEYGANDEMARWRFGDQVTVYAEKRPTPSRVERWRNNLAATPAWTGMAHAYLAALGPGLIKRLGYDYSELAGGLANPERPIDAAALVGDAIVTPAYGETSDLPSQISQFQDLLRRLKPLRRETLQAAAG